MDEAEKNRLARQLLGRIAEAVDRAGPLADGQPVPPELMAELKLLQAEGVAAGLIEEPERGCGRPGCCGCE